MNKAREGPLLELGQVWSFKGGTDIAIIGVSRHLAEYRRCRKGKVDCTGLSDLVSIRALQEKLVKDRARLTGHIVLTDRLQQGTRSRS
jgi:hypothetical protein